MRKRSPQLGPSLTEPPGGPTGQSDAAASAGAQGRIDAEPVSLDETTITDPGAASLPPSPAADLDRDNLAASGALVWPPPEDELNEWEVLHLHSSGQTVVEPMKYVPELGRAVPQAPPAQGPWTPAPSTQTSSTQTPSSDDAAGEWVAMPAPAAPPPLAFPMPAQRARSEPVTPAPARGETRPPFAPSLFAASPPLSARPTTDSEAATFHPAIGDEGLPETQVIEPLMLPALERALHPPPRPVDPPTTPTGAPLTPVSSSSAGFRPSAFESGRSTTPPIESRPRAYQRETSADVPPVGHDDTDPGLMTRILPAPPRFEKSRSTTGDYNTAYLEPGSADAGRWGVPNAFPTPAGPGETRTDSPASRHADPATESPRSPSLIDTLPTGIKLSSLYPKTLDPKTLDPKTLDPKTLSAEPPAPLGPPISAGDTLIHAQPLSVPIATPASMPTMGYGTAIPAGTRRQGLQFGSWSWRVALGLLALAVIAQIAWMSNRTLGPAAAAVPPATLVVNSSPAGASVLIDGRRLGVTPFRGEVPSGTYQLEVRSGEARRPLAITLQPGTLSSFTVELGAVEPKKEEPAATAAIEVRSDPPGARVTVGGVARGVTPLVVSGLKPGRHQVQVSGPFRAVTRTVTVAGGQQALLVVTPARSTDREPADEAPVRPAGGRGSFAITSPLVLRIVRNGDFIGTSEDARIQMPAGTHDISLENDTVGFRESRSIEVLAGRHVTIPIELPQGTININARPWADVFVDGQRVGETPVASLALPVGAHEVMFRHPNYPERRLTVIVKVGVAGRTFVDFTR